MRSIIRSVIQVLDGTPSVYGKPARGQSIVEMAFITPILIVLVVGVIEIGWLANNYLNLQEVAKVGARRGTVLSGDNSPFGWEANVDLLQGSILPASRTNNVSIDPEFYNFAPGEQAAIDTRRGNMRDCGNNDTTLFGFYNLILCQMLQSMSPLQMDNGNGVDDIAISVFAVQTVLNSAAGNVNLNDYEPLIDEYPDGFIPVVVGRYPTNANECNFVRAAPTDPGYIDGRIERDPFNYINDGIFPNLLTLPGVDPMPLELAELVNGVWVGGYDDAVERQRGFVYLGQHKIEPVRIDFSDGSNETFPVDCYGSEWTVYDIQEQISVPNFAIVAGEELCRDGTCVQTTDDLGEFLPNQGVVLVEIWWQHQLLLNLPVFSPVMNVLGDNQTTIYVWSAFPVPTVEPNIIYEPIP